MKTYINKLLHGVLVGLWLTNTASALDAQRNVDQASEQRIQADKLNNDPANQKPEISSSTGLPSGTVKPSTSPTPPPPPPPPPPEDGVDPEKDRDDDDDKDRDVDSPVDQNPATDTDTGAR